MTTVAQLINVSPSFLEKAELIFRERDESFNNKTIKAQDPKIEALQELYQLHPNINGQSVWFFPTLKKSAEGRILYEKAENRAYVYDMITQSRFSSFAAWMKALSSKRFFKGKKSALATIFLDSFTPHMVSKSAITQIFGRENCCQTARSLLLHFIVTKIKFPASTHIFTKCLTLDYMVVVENFVYIF